MADRDAGARLRTDVVHDHAPDGRVRRVWATDRPWYQWALRALPSEASAGRVVDFGCGRGELLGWLAERGIVASGLDRSREGARSAQAHGFGCVLADLERGLPYAEASLDGAMLVEVIEHVVHAEALAAELARVIRPGGWLVVTTPNVVHWTYRWRTLTGHPPKQEGYHLRFFTRETLEHLFETVGFERRASASFGKQAVATGLRRLLTGRRDKVRYPVPGPLEGLLAQHFVWRLVRRSPDGGRPRR